MSSPAVLPLAEGPSAFPGPHNAEVAHSEASTMKISVQGSPTSIRSNTSSGVTSPPPAPPPLSSPKMSRGLRLGSGKDSGPRSRSYSQDFQRPKKFQRVGKADTGYVCVAVENYSAERSNELSFLKGDKIEGKK